MTGKISTKIKQVFFIFWQNPNFSRAFAICHRSYAQSVDLCVFTFSKTTLSRSFQVQEWSERKYTIDGLEKVNVELQALIDKLRRELANYKNDYDILISEKRDIANEFAQLKAREQDLERSLQQVTEEKHRRQVELEDIRRELSETRREPDLLIQQVSAGGLETEVDMFPDMKDDLEAAKNETDRLANDISSWQSKYNTLQSSYDVLDGDKKRLEDKLDSMQKTINDLEHNNHILTSDKNKLTVELEAAKRKINDLLSELDEAKRGKDSLKVEFEILQKRITKMEAEYEIHITTRRDYDDSGAYVKLQEAYKRSQERENEVQAELLTCYKVIGELKHQLQGAQESIERLTINYNTETIRSATLRDEVVTYQRRLSELEEKYEINRGANEDMENELAVLEQRLTEASKQNTSIQESKALILVEVSNQRNKITRLEKDLEDAESEKTNLRLQLKAFLSKGESESDEISKQISELSERSLSFRREKEDLERQLSKKHAEYNESAQAIDALKAEIEDQRRTKSLEDQQRSGEIQSLKISMGELQRENEALKSESYASSTKTQIETFFDLDGGDEDLGPSAESTRYDLDGDDFEGGNTTVTTRTVKVKSSRSKKGKS